MNNKLSLKHSAKRPLLGVLAGLLTASAGFAQYTLTSKVNWLGVDSDYLNTANWSNGAVPDGNTGISFTNAAPNRTINLTHNGSGDVTYRVFSITTENDYGYTLNLQGNSAGRLYYNITGRGTHPWKTDGDGTSTGAAADRNPFYLNLKSYATITFDNVNSTLAGGASSTSGLGYAKIVMTDHSTIDYRGLTAGNVSIGGLSFDATSSVDLGSRPIGSLSALNLANEVEVWAGTITSTSSATTAYQKYGAGTTLVTGTANLPGIMTFRSTSSYIVDGVHNGNFGVGNSGNAYIGGSGVINGNIELTGGNGKATLGAGGNKADRGTLTVNGNVKPGERGVISLDFFTSAPNDHDQLLINGQVDFTAGGAISVGAVNSDDFVVKTESYKIISINGDYLGNIPEIDNPQVFAMASTAKYRVEAVAGGFEIWVDVIRNPFADVAGITRNQTAIATVFDKLGSALPDDLIRAADAQITASAYGKVLNQLGPQSYQAWYSAALVQSAALGTSIEHRLAVPDQEFRATKKLDFYTQVSRFESTVSASDYNEYYDFSPEQLILGADYAFSPSFLAGLVYTHDKTEFRLDDSGSTSTSKSNTFGVYGRYRNGAFQVNAIGTYGTDSYSADRSVRLSRLGTFAKADTDGTHYGVRAQASYKLGFSWIDVAPTVGAHFIKWEADAFRETGNANQATLIVDEQSADSLLLSFGVQIARSFSIIKNTAEIRPFLNVYFQRDTTTENRPIGATVMGEHLTVYSRNPDRDGWHIEGGVSVNYNNGLSLFASYGNDNNSIVDQTIALRGGLGWRF